MKSFLITCLATIFTLWAPLSWATRLVGITISRNVTEDMVAEGVTDAFPTDVQSIHAVALFSQVQPGTKVRAAWVSVDANETLNQEIDSTTVSLKAGEARAHFRISRTGDDWPPGNYKLNLYLDDILVTSSHFRIADKTIPGHPPDQPAATSETKPPADKRRDGIVGTWNCRLMFMGVLGDSGTVSFDASGTAILDDEHYTYEVRKKNVIRFRELGDFSDFTYTIEDDKLVMHFPDGLEYHCKRKQAAIAPKDDILTDRDAETAFGERDFPGADDKTGEASMQGFGAGIPREGAGDAWQLQGTFCFWSGSSTGSSSFSSSKKIFFDGQGHWSHGSEAAFSGDAGLAYGGGGNQDSGTYRVEGNKIYYKTSSGEQGVATVKNRREDGRITEIYVEGDLYSPSLCD